MLQVDWRFITNQEACRLVGYVPEGSDESGVTIATGVDLGQQGPTFLLGLPAGLPSRLRPYLGKKGEEARQALAAAPLAVSQGEGLALDGKARSELLDPLQAHFLQASGEALEAQIPAAQTVLASVCWQYGTPWTRCPRFWALAVARDWGGVVKELENFGDAYPSRREREAAYLQKALGAGAMA